MHQNKQSALQLCTPELAGRYMRPRDLISGRFQPGAGGRAHRKGQSLPCSLLAAEVLLDLVKGSPLRYAAMAAAQLVSGASAQTHARGAAGQHSPSTPAHAKHTTLIKVENFFQASKAQQRRGALTIWWPAAPRGGMRWRATSETGTPQSAAPIETDSAKRVVCRPAADIMRATF